ncbi:MAG TPA: bifunctional phosphoglucose/phosphomannose isomerase [Methanomassiliicoccales archaeon]|nr:bifunctional phosphoglucose/phosphomannose isomerase [Methanomassiliicoccales archaeon]
MVDPLDDLDNIRSIDISRTAEQMSQFADNLEVSAGRMVGAIKTPGSICLNGIGGSAMAADVLFDYLHYNAKVPVTVNRNVSLPKWVTKDSLSIITSYSGNTQEALDALYESVNAGCQICAISSGGAILNICRKEGIPFVEVPSGMQPRAALGHTLGAASAILQAAGVGAPATEMKRAAMNSRSAILRMATDSPTEQNPAKRLALQIHDRIPIIYAPRNIRSVAVRWQNQINENSKMLSFSGEIPEMDHNQLVGWLQGDKCNACRPVFLLPSLMDHTVEKMTMVSIEMFSEAGLSPMVVPLHGNTQVENLISGIILGDHVSYYMAILKGADPGPVPVIQEFKRRIA